ncbi:hypothetical protein ACFVFS_00340 [Kitasatospora sp. NPDC057692]|uniref:hypothetical protein n=1 Tax=Kitasatospora sp. NPDC057692 TaxID=3346215 RepID=UPI003685411E
MHQYRVVKYTEDERTGAAPAWTAISDIGRSFGGEVLTEPVYRAMEESYLAAVRRFAAVDRVTALRVEGLEIYPESPWWQRVADGDRLPLDEALELVRSVLREDYVWCQFYGDGDFFVHISYDYYMYLGVSGPPEQAVLETRASGLYVDDFASPFWD